MEGAGRFGVETKVELVFPAKFKTGLAQGVVAVLRARVAFGEIGGMSRDLVSDDPILHVFLIRQAEVLFGGDIAKHGTAVPADHRRADGAGDMVVTGSDVGGERPEGVKRSFVAPFQLF